MPSDVGASQTFISLHVNAYIHTYPSVPVELVGFASELMLPCIICLCVNLAYNPLTDATCQRVVAHSILSLAPAGFFFKSILSRE